MERRTQGRWLHLAALAAAAASVAPEPSQAQRVTHAPPCGQLCDAGARRNVEQTLGLAPLSRREGLVAYRLLAVTSWGRPLPAMTFFRQGSGVAFVEVRALLPSEGRLQLSVARWPVDPAIWDRLRTQIDAMPAQEAAPPTARAACAEGWSYSLRTVRDRDVANVQGACPDAIQDLADDMAQDALDANPACPGKAPRDGGPYGRLEHCLAAVASPSPAPPRP